MENSANRESFQVTSQNISNENMADEDNLIKVVAKTTNTKETIEIEPNATIGQVAVILSFNTDVNQREFTLNLVYISLVQSKGIAKIQ
jgi:hypothetical protein